MNLSRRWLEALLGRSLDPAQVADLLFQRVCPVEAVEPLQRRQDLRAVSARTLFGALVEQVLGIELAQPVVQAGSGAPQLRTVRPRERLFDLSDAKHRAE